MAGLLTHEWIANLVLKKIADKKTTLTPYLKEFKKVSAEKCLEALGRYP